MTISRPDRRLLTDPGHLLSLGFGTGLVPLMPGTFGTLIGVLLYLPLQNLPLWLYLVLTAALFAIGVPLCERTAHRIGLHDHPAIVWDEVVGFLIAMSLAPAGGSWIVIGFVLFRFFDILKPWPIRQLDRTVTGGFGIMFDDAVAGLYAGAVLYLLVRLSGVFSAA